MTRSHLQSEDYSRFDDDQDAIFEVEPADRIGAPVSESRRGRWLIRLVLFALAGIGVAKLLSDPDQAQSAFATAKSIVDASMTVASNLAASRQPTPPQPAQATVPDKPPPLPESTVHPVEASVTAGQAGAAHDGSPALGDAPAAEAMGTAYSATAQPAEATPDKVTKRAAAVGLGPDLPNVLLTRLTQKDMQNAGYAIKTALLKTGDDATFSWPRSPSQKQALFEVRFVPGAPEGCRRYVVTVTKERWSSTSGAVEKCQGDRAEVASKPVE